MAYEPPFTLNDEILNLVADIAQKVGRVEAYDQLNASPQLRRENRIRTIHSSLAIENNALSFDQVTAVIEGRHVIAPARDVLEVQNALTVYESLDMFKPESIEDLLKAHSLLMVGLTPEAGRFRSGNVGVFDGDKLVHAGTPAHYVPEVIGDLFEWLRRKKVHPLVASCAFHYEFEFVHPFADGNGRMGRLWRTLILSDWSPLFAWLPVESLVKQRQAEYYAALGRADARADCTNFIVFMLKAISDALDDALSLQNGDSIKDGINVGITNEAEAIKGRLLHLVRQNPTITASQMANELGVGKRQVERLIANLKANGRLVRIGANRNGHWEVEDD